MELYIWKNFSKEERIEFFQSKYDYYSSFTFCLIAVSVCAYLSFFITDCEIYGRFAYETLLSRVIVVLPFAVFCILHKKVKNYRIMIPATYLMIHIIIWLTDWATYILPDRQQAIPGMMIMNLIFVCAGFAAPFRYSTIAHLIMIADIAVANMFIHYENIDMMYLFNVPAIISVCIMNHMMQKVYLEQYITKGRLVEMVVLDQLTGTFNRKKMKELSVIGTGELNFPKEIAVSMLLIDIDYFKKVNDRYGHEAGDTVLVHLAHLFKSSVRSTDYVIRWGGEEFLIIMPGCDSEQAVRVAEKIREKTEQSNNGVCKTTISIGVALYEGGNYQNTMKKADEAMYQAKTEGRNRVVLYNNKGN